jgi:hypothetical protein
MQGGDLDVVLAQHAQDGIHFLCRQYEIPGDCSPAATRRLKISLVKRICGLRQAPVVYQVRDTVRFP